MDRPPLNCPLVSRRGFVGSSLAGLAAWGTRSAADEVAGPSVVAPGGNPFVYKFHIGEVEAWSISDANLALGEGLGLMWPEEARPAMQAAMDAHGEPLNALPLYVNVLVLRAGKETLLFDSGFGGRSNPRLGWLTEGLQAAGIAPDSVTAGFLSHAHADHLNGFVLDGKPAFRNAALHMLPTELAFWRSKEPDFSKSKRDKRGLPGMIAEVRQHFEVLEPNISLLEDGAELFGGLVRIEAAPGHTAGHACFRIRSGDDELLHLMDLAHHHLLMFADPEWTIAFDHDPAQSVVTRRKYWSEAAARRTRCYGFHLPWPGLGRIMPDGEGYRWWAESWRWPA